MIYFVQAEHGGPVKIGYTAGAVDVRLESLQTGSPFRLVCRATIQGDLDAERGWHARFAADRLIGEWFRVTPSLIEAVGEAAICEEYLHDWREAALALPKLSIPKLRMPEVEVGVGCELGPNVLWHGPLLQQHQIIVDSMDSQWRRAPVVVSRIATTSAKHLVRMGRLEGRTLVRQEGPSRRRQVTVRHEFRLPVPGDRQPVPPPRPRLVTPRRAIWRSVEEVAA